MTVVTDSEDTRAWTWAAVEGGLWGPLDHEFAGLVEQQVEHGYSPADDQGQALGTFRTRTDARSALEAAHPLPVRSALRPAMPASDTTA